MMNNCCDGLGMRFVPDRYEKNSKKESFFREDDPTQRCVHHKGTVGLSVCQVAPYNSVATD